MGLSWSVKIKRRFSRRHWLIPRPTAGCYGMSDRRPFLTARWRHLLMLNFEVDPDCLVPLVPPGTELDLFDGRCLVSIVAFEFSDARLYGVRIPGYQSFPEVNLRFYVRRWVDDGWRRGVVFIKELVPLRVVAQLARRVFGQNFAYAPMRYRIEGGEPGRVTGIRYNWLFNGCPSCAAANVGSPSGDAEHAFVAEHFYAYATRESGCIEYRVEHRPWVIHSAGACSCDLNAELVYGGQIGRWLRAEPRSALYANGSAVAVYPGVRLASGSVRDGSRLAHSFAPCS
jgi:uncharacterized protein